MTQRHTPWPARTPGDLWGPSYRLLLSTSVPGVAPLLVTEGTQVLVRDDADAIAFAEEVAQRKARRLEVGISRSDIPKELDSSWRQTWASLPHGTIEVSETLDSNSEGVTTSRAWWDEWLNVDHTANDANLAAVSVCVLGCFVRPKTARTSWVPIAFGVVLTISKRTGEWRDLILSLSNDKPPEASTTRPKEPRDIKLTLVMFATLVVWIFKYFDSRSSDAVSGAYAFFNILHAQAKADWLGHMAIVLFVIVHHLRMAAGVEFATRDTSFFRAKLHAPISRRDCRAWIESSFLATIVGLSVFLTYAVGFSDYFWSAVVLGFQGALVAAYDWIFRDALLTFDEDRKANYFVLFGDGMFCAVTALLIGARLWDAAFGQTSSLGQNTAGLLLGGCYIYTGIFLVEVVLAYWPAARGAGAEIAEAARQLRSGRWKLQDNDMDLQTARNSWR